MYYNNIQLTKLAAELDAIQSVEHTGTGVECVQRIILKMRQGDCETAKLIYRNETDKVRSYPRIHDKLKEVFGT